MSVVFQEVVHGELVTKLLYQVADLSVHANATFTTTDGRKERRDKVKVGGATTTGNTCIFVTATDAASLVAQGLLTLVNDSALSTLCLSGSTFTINLSSVNH